MLDARDLVLVISDKPDVERDAVAAAWEAAGGEVLRLGRFWEPPPLDAARVRVYGADAFCQVLAQKLALTLVTPPDDLLLDLPVNVLKRVVRPTTVSVVESLAPTVATHAAAASEVESLAFPTFATDAASEELLAFPTFVKSYIPKLIRSRVYASASDLAGELKGLEPSTQLLVSDVIELVAEARAWVLDGEVLSIACYEGNADLADARRLATETARSTTVPSPCVIDIGLTPDRGWVVIEANAAWGAGLNGCDALAAARCIARASHTP